MRVIACLLGSLAFAGGLQGAVIFNNLTETAFLGAASSSVVWQAQAFSTTDTGYVVTEVILPLSTDDGTTGAFYVDIYDALGTSGLPGVLVQNIYSSTAGTLPTNSTNLTISGLNVALQASTAYYLVLRGGADLSGTVWWDYTESTNGVGLPSAYSLSEDAGVSWDGPALTFPSMMKIVTSGSGGVVPEPTSFAMLVIGAAGLAGVGAIRRRARRSTGH